MGKEIKENISFIYSMVSPKFIDMFTSCTTFSWGTVISNLKLKLYLEHNFWNYDSISQNLGRGIFSLIHHCFFLYYHIIKIFTLAIKPMPDSTYSTQWKLQKAVKINTQSAKIVNVIL